MHDLLREMRGILCRVLRRYAEQDQIARLDLTADFPLDFDGRLFDSCDYGAQKIPSFCPMCLIIARFSALA